MDTLVVRIAREFFPNTPAKSTRVQITGLIEVSGSGIGQYTLSFGYQFDAGNKIKGKISRGHAADIWRVETHSDGFEIIYHRGTVTN